MPKTKPKTLYRDIELQLIDPPNEIARLDIPNDKIVELATSIEHQGLLQPIVVSPEGDRYQIVAGHRRYLAYQYLKLPTISCRVMQLEPEATSLARATENLQRADLSPIEEALIYHGLYEKFDYRYDRIARMTGISPGVVQRRLNLLQMTPPLIDAVHQRLVSQTVAEELQRCPDEAKKEYFLSLAIDHGITKEIARKWVDEFKKDLRNKDHASDPEKTNAGYDVPHITYVSCFLCQGPVDVMKAKPITVCPECYKKLIDIIQQT